MMAKITLTSDLVAINETLEALVKEKTVPHDALYIAAKYSLLAPGKRIRPMLAVATGKMFGASLDALVRPACALELIHTYSLIHDDLPAMDDDDFRRGKPSLHKMHGEALAILAGDYLLTYAFEVLAEAPGLTEKQRLRLITTLAKASGGDGMIGGQVMDLTKTEQNLELVNRMKTGALLCASIEFGGIIAGVADNIQHQLRHMGETIGLLFQVCDDILDKERPDITEAKQEAFDLYNLAVRTLSSFTGDASALKEIFRKIIAQIQ